MRRSSLCLPLLCALACADADEGLPGDAAVGRDAAAEDARIPDAGAPPLDAAAPDLGLGAEDAGAADLGVFDAGAKDTGAEGPRDLGVSDGGASDADVHDAGAPDDAGRPDAGAADAGGCAYVNVSECIVDCGGVYTYVREFTEANGRCPPFVRLNGNDYPDVAAAVTAEACSGTCIYKAFQSVSFIDHCNRRNGYIVYTANNCSDLYEFSNGLFPSVADWEAATPCP